MVYELMTEYGYSEEHAREIVEMYEYMGLLDDLRDLIDAKHKVNMAVKEDV